MPDTNETALEKTFSDLAYSHLRDKSQSLLEYLVGFQMLKQEDDGQRAVGIFGFEIGGDYYYAPIFFLNGEVRGLDSLYSVKSDLFMPLTDGWVNTIINRRQITLGEQDTRAKSQRGVHVPNYTRLKIIPGGGGTTNLKLAEAMMGSNADLAQLQDVSLTDELNAVGAGPWLKQAMDSNPRLREAFEKFGYNLIDLIPEPELPQTEKRAAQEAVILVNSITDEGVGELTDEQREQVLEGGTAVIDNRPEVSKSILYTTEVKRILENPTMGSMYDVLWACGKVTPCLVCPVADGSNHVFVFCTRDKTYCCIERDKVFTVRAYSQSEMNDWLKDNAKTASDVRPREVVVFISRDGVATPGFCIESVRTGLDGITCYGVHDTHRMDAGTGRMSRLSSGWPIRGNNGNPPHNAFMDLSIGGNGGPASGVPNYTHRPRNPGDCVSEVLVTEVGGSDPRFTKTQCVVNDKCFMALKINSFRLVTDKQPWGDTQHEKYDDPNYEVILSCEDFGDYNTVYQAMDKQAADLKVWKTGSDITIKVADVLETFRTERDGLHVCMRKLGMSEDDARYLIKSAASQLQKFKFRPTTKYAAQLLDMPETDDADLGGFLTSFHRQQVPFQTLNRGQSVDNREFYRYNSPFGGGGASDVDGEVDTFEVVQQAAQTGEKEVFDAAALGALIKNHNPTDLVDRFLPTIISGMDRIGRMLFLIYWHFEDFEERYGEDDLSEFIDNLRSVFEQLGDVVVFAKKRTLAGDPEHYGMGMMPMMEGE